MIGSLLYSIIEFWVTFFFYLKKIQFDNKKGFKLRLKINRRWHTDCNQITNINAAYDGTLGESFSPINA